MINSNLTKQIIKKSLGLEVEISGVERIGTTHEYVLSTSEGKIKFNALNATVEKIENEECIIPDPNCIDPNCVCVDEVKSDLTVEEGKEEKIEGTNLEEKPVKKKRVRKSKDNLEETV